jgi:hypothetical protein
MAVKDDMEPAGPVKIFGVTLSPSPDLRPTRRLIAAAGVLGLMVCARLCWNLRLVGRLGDTDDATRLVIVRDLLAGRGWYDQWLGRMGPPQGLYIHWSRILDAALAGVEGFFHLFLPQGAAELAMRFSWPLALVFPAIGAGLAVGRNLGGRSAVLLTLCLMADPILYRQFIPGRIDHHNVQILLTVAAFACALTREHKARWAALAGLATALDLAIGLEAIAFHALIGGAYALALARDRKAAKPAVAYGSTLAAASVAFFLIQTPPARWSLSFCDALALNLVMAVIVAGAGLALSALAAAKSSPAVRIAMVGLTGLATAAVYVLLHPACVHGPFAEINPAVKAIWLDRVQETLPLPAIYKSQREGALQAAFMGVWVLIAAAFLALREGPRVRTELALMAAALIAAVPIGYFAWRMQDYVFWLGTPVLGAAASWMSERRLRGLMVPSVVATMGFSPVVLGLATSSIVGLAGGAQKARAATAAPGRDTCLDQAAYASLAGLPKGVVFAEEDLGPFILAFTNHSIVAAPYHRMSDRILAVHQIWSGPPAVARWRLRSLGATYVVDCPAYPLDAPKGGLGAAIRGGKPPAWLAPMSRPKDTIQIYKPS